MIVTQLPELSLRSTIHKISYLLTRMDLLMGNSTIDIGLTSIGPLHCLETDGVGLEVVILS